MAFDLTWELYDAALNTAPNTNLAGSAVALGHTGLPKDAQFCVIIDNPAGTAGDSPGIVVHLQVALDNVTTYRTVATIDLGDPSDGFQGQRVVNVGQDFNAQEYADANINVRVQIVPTGNASNNVTADRLFAALTHGETSIWGRAQAADTLFV